MSAAEILEQIKNLPPDEQRLVAEKAWEKYGGFEDELTREQITELDRRLVEFEKNSHDGVPWDQVEASLNKRFGWK